jgi:hypothetical protein
MVGSLAVSYPLRSGVTGAGKTAFAAELRDSVELVSREFEVSAAGRDRAASVPDSGANAPLTRA